MKRRVAPSVVKAVPSALLFACMALAAAAPAQAAEAETHLHVTSPAGLYVLDDEVTGEDAITLTGTSNLSAGQKIDINCYSGSGLLKLAENVEVGAGGSFSFGGFLHAIADQTCVLRAVPHSVGSTDYPPNTPSRFTGPTLAIGQRYDRTIASGPNAGKLKSQYLYDSQLAGAFDYGSLGDCSIIDSYTYDPITYSSPTTNRLDACNAFLWWENGKKGAGFAPPTRSDIQVDGADAFLPANIPMLFSGAESLAGFPTLSDKDTLDPTTGDVLIEEGEPVVKCSPGGTFPPTAESCTALVPTGVQAFLKILQSGSGRIASVTQYFEATDGHPHQIDLLDDNEFFAPREDGEFYFPWLSPEFKQYTTPGQALSAPAPGPSTFYVKASASEGVQGAVTLSSPPEGESVVGTTDNSSETSRINLHYSRTIPAGQYVALGFTYADGFGFGEVEAAAAAAQAAYLPHVAILTPAGGTVTAAASITLAGNAGDAAGLASLVVAGQTVPVSSTGTWSASVPLVSGANTITATATNIFGNTSAEHVSVTRAAPAGPTELRLVGKPGLAASGVAFTIRCLAAAGLRCTGTGTLTVRERTRGGRLIGLSAHAHGRRHAPPALVVGSQPFSVAAGAHMRVVVALNHRGQRLLARFGTLPVRLDVEHTRGRSAGGPQSLGSKRLRLRILRTGRIARSIERVIRSARHIRARVTCPAVAVEVKGGRFTCVATGSVGRGSHAKRFHTSFTVLETDARGDVRFYS